jgi:hypothetical protein
VEVCGVRELILMGCQVELVTCFMSG